MVREDKNITLLLKALEDKNVQKKLFQILDAREYNRASKEKETENVIAHTADAEELKRLLMENERLQEQLQKKSEEFDRQIHEKDGIISDYKNQIRKLQDDQENQKTSIQKREKDYKEIIRQKETEAADSWQKLEGYQEQFGMIEDIQKSYKALSETTKENLKNLIPGDSMMQILNMAMQSEKIEALWEYCAFNKKDSEFSRLKEIFTGCFKILQNSNEDYCLEKPEIGTEFDDEIHMKDGSCMVMSGKIREVILEGYRKGKNIIRKPLVKIQ